MLQPPGAGGDGAAGDEAAGDDGVGSDALGHAQEEEELRARRRRTRGGPAGQRGDGERAGGVAAAAAVAAQFDSAASARLQDAASKLVERTERLQAAERKIGVIRTKLRERSAGRRRQLPQQDRASSPVRMGSASRRGSPAQVHVRSPLTSRRASRSSSPEVMHGEVVPEEEDEVLRAWQEEDGELKGCARSCGARWTASRRRTRRTRRWRPCWPRARFARRGHGRRERVPAVRERAGRRPLYVRVPPPMGAGGLQAVGGARR